MKPPLRDTGGRDTGTQGHRQDTRRKVDWDAGTPPGHQEERTPTIADIPRMDANMNVNRVRRRPQNLWHLPCYVLAFLGSATLKKCILAKAEMPVNENDISNFTLHASVQASIAETSH